MEQETQQLPGQLEEGKPVPVEQQISNALVKHNVTEAKILELREKYLPLKINGIEDKENYIIVKEARKDCKAWRVLAEKLCKKGREDAVAIQKAWVSKEKDITGRIGEVENYLEKQEKEYEVAVEKDKAERRRKQEEQLILRQQVLSNMSVLYADGNYTLGEVSFELSVVKECEQDIWEESILPKFKVEYEKIEAERLEQERIKQEREAELKRQQEELERKQKELAEKEAALKAAQEEQERKQREEEQRKIVEENQRKEKLWRDRLEQLQPIRWNGQEAFPTYDEGIIVATYDELISWTDEEFQAALSYHKERTIAYEKQQEEKRLAEIEVQKEAERKKTLGISRSQSLKAFNYINTAINALADYTEEEWNELHDSVKKQYEEDQRKKWEKEQEEKRKADELKKQQEMEQAKEKEKWADIINQLNNIQIHEFKSGQYNAKVNALKRKLEEIKSL